MVISEFGCLDFRNYKELFLKFSGELNLFVGKNGQGKSNLAEAIFFLNHLDSFRTHRLANLVRRGQLSGHIQGLGERSRFPVKSRIEISKIGRKVWLNEVPVRKLSAYVTEFYAVVFNPDELHAYRHFPQERRGFFDRFISFVAPDYLQGIRDFRSVLGQRNKLLKNGDFSALTDWNVLFVEKACVIINKRRAIIEEINSFLPDMYHRLTGKPEALQIVYRPSMGADTSAALQLLNKARESEIRAGHALYGPHRDDFQMKILPAKNGAENGGEFAQEPGSLAGRAAEIGPSAERKKKRGEGTGRGESFFSQGEYRISLLALKMVAGKLVEQWNGFNPVMILDDLFSELDATIRENLRQYFSSVPNQVFITSTDLLPGFDTSAASVMEISGGNVL